MSGRGVVVLGMHRSGTSAVTGLLVALGLRPVAADLLPADEANRRGYWESAALVAANDTLLEALGAAWAYPPARLAGPAPTPAPPPGAGADGWVWKDPRLCLTLPCWGAALGRDPVVVVVHRDPLEVAGSLAARDGFEPAHGLALWERYARHALAHAAGLPALVCRYDRLLEDPPGLAREARAFLAAHGLDLAAADEAAAAAAVDPGLRRALRSRAALSPAQAGLAAALAGLEGSHGALAPPSLPPETEGLDAVLLRAASRDLARAHARARHVLESRTFRWTAPARRLAAALGLA